MNRLATLVKVIQLVGDVTGGCADGVAGEVAGGGHDSDSDHDDERTNESADPERRKRQADTDCRADGSARDDASDRTDRPANCGIVTDVRADFAVKSVLAGSCVDDGESRTVSWSIASSDLRKRQIRVKRRQQSHRRAA